MPIIRRAKLYTKKDMIVYKDIISCTIRTSLLIAIFTPNSFNPRMLILIITFPDIFIILNGILL